MKLYKFVPLSLFQFVYSVYDNKISGVEEKHKNTIFRLQKSFSLMIVIVILWALLVSSSFPGPLKRLVRFGARKIRRPEWSSSHTERDVARKRWKCPTRIVRGAKTMAGNYQPTRIYCFVFFFYEQMNEKIMRKAFASDKKNYTDVLQSYTRVFP